jgi:acyl carrier protein
LKLAEEAASRFAKDQERGEDRDMQPAEIKDQVREFIMKIAIRRGVQSVADDDSLTAAGVLDSLGIFRLVTFLEETFAVGVSDEEITIENFQSINAIQEFVSAKQQGA